MIHLILLISTLVLCISCGTSESSYEGNEPGNSNSFLREDEAREIESGVISEYKSRAELIFNNSEEWKSHYSLHRGNEFNRENTPNIDFTYSNIAAIHLGSKNKNNYRIILKGISFDKTDNTWQIRYQALNTNENLDQNTYPYLLLRIGKTNGPYRFIQEG